MKNGTGRSASATGERVDVADGPSPDSPSGWARNSTVHSAADAAESGAGRLPVDAVAETATDSTGDSSAELAVDSVLDVAVDDAGKSTARLGGKPVVDPDVDRARGGDEGAFGRLVEPYRNELHAHCYRMLGSLHDAEDATQEVLLRAWRGVGGFAGRSSFRTWLHTIATNSCLRMIERRPRRVLPVGLDHDLPSTEWAWLQPYPDERLDATPANPQARYDHRESIELAFVAAVQHLPASQRAALMLRDVLGFSAKETANALETTVAAANSALQRARKTVAEHTPARSQQAAVRDLDDAKVRELVRRYIKAWENRDVAAIVGMLTEDAKFAMPPEERWYRGHSAIAGFLRERPLTLEWKSIRIGANGQLALATYARRPGSGTPYRAIAVDVLSLRGQLIEEITAFLDPGLFPVFGLPAEWGSSRLV